MTNKNCLEGIKCPQCGNEDRFMIAAHIVAEVTDDGADVAPWIYGNHWEWSDSSMTECPVCGRGGPLREFRIRPDLPPDPEGMNDKRSDWAAATIATFRQLTGTDVEDAVCDLVGDLMHWCDRNGQNFDHELQRGRDHYEAETLPES